MRVARQGSASASVTLTVKIGTIPTATVNNWDYDRSKKDFSRYLEDKSKPQLRELLISYGLLGLVWFDRGMDTNEHAREFVELVHTLQPRCLINGRVGGYGQDLLGDYQDMNDNGMPTGGLQEYWETTADTEYYLGLQQV